MPCKNPLLDKHRLETIASAGWCFRDIPYRDTDKIQSEAYNFLSDIKMLMAFTCLYGDLGGFRSDEAMIAWDEELHPPPTEEDLARWAEEDWSGDE